MNGILHFVIVEDNINYSWQGMTKLNFVARDMLPDAFGESVTIPPGDSIIRSRDFTISQDWDVENCKIVVFVQASNKEIYQGDEVGIIGKSELDYYGMSFTDSDGDGVAEPGENLNLIPSFKNMGTGEFPGGYITLSANDPYINITLDNSFLDLVEVGNVGTVSTPFTLEISPDCPNPNQVNLYFTTEFHTDTVPLIITTQPGFFDDMESGENGWTHWGTRDHWHITDHTSHSPSNSWYCGIDGSWQYTNENDASLVSRWFVVTPESALVFWHRYGLEAGYDYGHVEIDNGSGWWKTIDIFDGTQSVWSQTIYPLTEYSGQTVRIRFRFISDYSITDEGWYIDDVSISSPVAIKENSLDPTNFSFYISPTISKSSFEILFSLEDSSPNVEIGVYDVSGRLVKKLINSQFSHKGLKRIVWNGFDKRNRRVKSGVYFIRIESESLTGAKRVIILR